MEKSQLLKLIKQQFSSIDQTDLLQEIVSCAHYLEIPSSQSILNKGDYIKVIPLVLEGAIKVSRVNESDKEVFLYHILAGESCALTLSSCLKMERSKITAISVQPSKILALPVEKVYDFNKRYPSWQHFIIRAFTDKFGDFLHLIEDFSFNHIINRLINHLDQLHSIHKTSYLTISHRQLANDLATSREVVSRILKQLEKQELVSLHRGKIKLHPLFFIKKAEM